MTAETQATLDRAGCDTPGCTEPHDVLYYRQFCHPRAGLSASYAKPTGHVTLRCAKCNAKVVEIKVAAA